MSPGLIPDFDIPLTKSPVVRTDVERDAQLARLTNALKEAGMLLIAHYYTDPDVQALADLSGGFIGDSLAMAQFGQRSEAKSLMVAGVRFMGETAKILSPEKHIYMPTLEATCSLDLSCPADRFAGFCDEHADRTVVVYANTSAAVKAQSD